MNDPTSEGVATVPVAPLEIVANPATWSDHWLFWLITAVLAVVLVMAATVLKRRYRDWEAQKNTDLQMRVIESMIKLSPTASLLVNKEGRIKMVNAEVLSMFGYQDSQLLDKPIEILIPERYRKHHVSFREGYDGEKRKMAPARRLTARKADGSELDIEVTLGVIQVDKSAVTVVKLMDVTERGIFMRQLQESEKAWRELGDAVPQLIWTTDDKGQIRFLNEPWGVENDALDDAQRQQVLEEAYFPDDYRQISKFLAQRNKQALRAPQECRIKLSGGDYRWYELKISCVLDSDRSVKTWIGSNTDIHQRKLAEARSEELNQTLGRAVKERTQELMEAQSNLRNIVNAVPTMIGFWDSELENQFSNDTLRSFLTLAKSLGSTQGMNSLYDELFSLRSEHVKKVLSGEATRFEKEIQITVGCLSYFDVYYIPKTISDKVSGFYVLLQDMTKTKTAQSAAEAALNQKSKFIALVSHEMRTPLNAIMGYSNLLTKQLKDPQLLDEARTVASSANMLMDILNDILDLSKVESGKFELERINFDLQDTLRTSWGLYRMAAQDKGLDYQMDTQAIDPGMMVNGDPTRLRQVIHNLISNAIKFTKQGQIKLTARYMKGRNGQGSLRVEVRDSGKGIPQSQQQQLFTPYTQASKETYREHGGTGLGLSIIKSIVTAMEGAIWFESTEGKGTTFFFEVPMQEALPEPTLKAMTADAQVNGDVELAPRKILIVDDLPVNLKILKKILENDHHAVDMADSGAKALDMIEQQKYDLIMLDISMPDMDGYETTRQIRAGASANATTPIYALSGHAYEENIKQALDAGMNGHLSKPLQIEKIRETIAGLSS